MELLKFIQHKDLLVWRLKKILDCLVIVSLALMANIVTAQNGEFVFAITNFNTTGSGWDALRKLDLKTGEFSSVLFNGSDTKFEAYDALTKKMCNANMFANASLEKNINTPFSTGVAAAAYDQRNNRLYFTPIAIDQLRYIDLSSMKLYYVMDQSLRTSNSDLKNEGEIITRMTVAPDGYGYAISNDGNSFIRFKTGENIKIEQLGPLKDDSDNEGVSIHDHCNSWGGDMVADDEGNLYVLSARNTIFKIDIETRSAKFISVLKGLPRGFTIDGAVVTSEGKLLVCSTRNSNDYYLIDTKDWGATPYKAKEGIFRSSDLANGNYLHSNPKDILVSNISDSKISLYPNPVNAKKFTLQFKKMIPGNYTVQMFNIKRNLVMRQNVRVQDEEQSVTIAIASADPMNLYVVELTSAEGTVVFTQKILVQ